MGKILALSGRKQAGKSTSFRFVAELNGSHGVPVREFSFAGPLKKFCVEVLGLTHEQVYGTDDQKNSPVPHILWENFPLPAFTRPDGSTFVGRPDGTAWKASHGSTFSSINLPIQLAADGSPGCRMPDGVVIHACNNPSNPGLGFELCDDKLPEWSRKLGGVGSSCGCVSVGPLAEPTIWHAGDALKPRTGPMTARELMQRFGTDVCRKLYPTVWADSCIRAIAAWHEENPEGVAVISDARFPDEVEKVHEAGGKVLRLTRSPFDDPHPSEHALDPEVFDWERFDRVLDNSDMDVALQFFYLYPILTGWGMSPLVKYLMPYVDTVVESQNGERSS